jgi:hypothetical protein
MNTDKKEHFIRVYLCSSVAKKLVFGTTGIIASGVFSVFSVVNPNSSSYSSHGTVKFGVCPAR